jgi:hypothetical protein
MSERVPFPMFEFAGPPCKEPSCKGVLTPTYTKDFREGWMQCSVCKTQWGRKGQNSGSVG